MILTNNQIFKLYESLNILKENKQLPIKVGFALLQNIKTIEPIYQSVITLRDNLAIENGDVNEQGRVSIHPDKIEYVNQELSKLGLEETEVNLRMIKLKDIENINMSLEDLIGLEIIIEEELED